MAGVWEAVGGGGGFSPSLLAASTLAWNRRGGAGFAGAEVRLGPGPPDGVQDEEMPGAAEDAAGGLGRGGLA